MSEPTPYIFKPHERPTLPGSPANPDHPSRRRLAYLAIGVLVGITGGLGNALVAHANGQLSPAAEYAFRRAIRLDPEGPAPRYFFGLALAQSGQFKQAKDLWTQLLASAPEGSAWKTDLENNLAMLDRAIAGEAPPMP